MMTQDFDVDTSLASTDDEQLARRIYNFIAARVALSANQITVEADAGLVTLRGSVGSFYQKQLWLSGAQRVAGVLRVIDEIEVQVPRTSRRQPSLVSG